MPLTIEAIYEDGVLKPDVPLTLPSMTRVRLIVEPLTAAGHESEKDAVLSLLDCARKIYVQLER